MTTTEAMRSPTPEECTTNARAIVQTKHGPRSMVAAWYPQMGGYVGRAWLDLHVCVGVSTDGVDDGFDVYVFHDGEVPFQDDRSPVYLRHCSARQFVAFGELVGRLSVEPHDE